MELRVLKYFLAVAQEENITRAAERLHVTQPTLSRQLMDLEAELDTKLFTRGRHSISLTEDGLILKQRAQEIMDLSEKIKQDFIYKDDILAGTVSIGGGEIRSMNIVSKLIAEFHKKHPNVLFEIHSAITDDIKDGIEKGLIDVGVMAEPVDVAKYNFIRMNEKEEWGVLTKHGSKLAEKEYISPEDLMGVPLIMAIREGVRNEIANWFGEFYDKLDIAATCDLLYNTAVLVNNNVGAAVCIRYESEYQDLCFKPLHPAIETGSLMVWRKNRTFSRAADKFIEFAKRKLRNGL